MTVTPSCAGRLLCTFDGSNLIYASKVDAGFNTSSFTAVRTSRSVRLSGSHDLRIIARSMNAMKSSLLIFSLILVSSPALADARLVSHARPPVTTHNK
jgi:hypothetical protein